MIDYSQNTIFHGKYYTQSEHILFLELFALSDFLIIY